MKIYNLNKEELDVDEILEHAEIGDIFISLASTFQRVSKGNDWQTDWKKLSMEEIKKIEEDI